MTQRRRRAALLHVMIALILGVGVLPQGSRPQEAPSSSSPVAAHSATWLADGRLLVAGGATANGPSSVAQIFDATRDPLGLALTTPRLAHSATLRPDGTVLIAGGQNPQGVLASLETIDPVTGRSTVVSLSLLHAVAEHAAVLLPDGRVLVLGGRDRSDKIVASVQTVDVPNSHTVELIDLIVGRAGHTATLLADGRVLVAGGTGPSGVLDSVELWDSSRLVSAVSATALSTPRSGHAAVLLPTGEVLLIGGVGQDGRPLATIEIFDPSTGSFRTSPAQLGAARSRHSATLLPSGDVLVGGGVDGNRTVLSAGELIDPRTSTVRAVNGMPSPLLSVDQTAPTLLWSRPVSGATDIALTSPIVIGFSEPLAVTTVSPVTMILAGPAGPVGTTVIPTGDGLVAWVAPTEPLTPATSYTLTLVGLTDTAGHALPTTVLRFTTMPSIGGSAPGGVSPPTTGASNDASKDPLVWTGEWRQGRPYSSWQSLPPLQAPSGVTALAGQVLRLDGEPLGNVTLRMDARTARTDNTGRFLLTRIPPGPQVLFIDGRSANTGTATFGVFEVSVAITDKITNVLPYTSWMPRIDTAHAVTIASPTTADVVISNPRLPGLEIHIPPHTVVRDRDGQVATQLSLTPIPTDRPPFPVPVDFPVYFTLQPNGAHLETHRGAFNGARVRYPNARKHRPDTEANFWSYEPEGGVGWYRYGLGRVTADASSIAPDPGTRIYKFTMHSYEPWSHVLPSAGPPPGHVLDEDGEPVNLSTGLFVMKKTDLMVADVLPVVIERTYRTGDVASRPFGIGMTHAYDLFLWADASQQCPVYYLVLPDGGRLTYARQGGSTCIDTTFVHTSSPTVFYQSTINCAVTDVWHCWLRLKDGSVYTFDGYHSLQSIQDRYGNTLTVKRDLTSAGKRILSVTSPNKRTLNFLYDTGNRVTQIQDDLGRVVTYEYDANGRLWRVTDPTGGVTEYTYENTTNHRMRTIKDARGIVYLTNEYDALSGRITRQTLADPTATYQFSYTTDSGGHITQTDVTDPRGYLRRVAFNANGYVASDARAVGQPEAQTTTLSWNLTTNLLQSTTDPLGRLTTYTYDSRGNILTITRLADRPADAITTTFQYEPTYSRVTSVAPSQWTTDGTETIAYTGLTQATITDARGKSAVDTYNAAGQVRTITDPLAQMTEFVYDSQGNPTDLYDPLRNRTTRSYDSVGRLATQTDPRGRATSFVYDLLNQLTAIGDAAGGVTRFSYDPNGNLLSVTDARGNTTTYHYDGMDRLDQRTDPLTKIEMFHYDKNGNLDQFTNRKSQVTTFTYDGLNRRTGATSPGISTMYTWDNGNRLTQLVDSVGGTVTNAFDDLDRLTAQTTALGTVTYPEYDSLGRRRQMLVPGQATVFYQWDAASRLTQIAQGATQMNFAHDDANRRASLALPNGVTTVYGYDVGARLTSLIYTNSTGELGRLTYGYDAGGNRTAVGGSFARTLLPAPITAATYDPANRQLTFGDTSLQYDFNGNPTTLTRTTGDTVFTWDARDRLVAVSAPPSTSGAFVYDGLGRRVARTVNGTTTEYVYDDADIVKQQISSSTTNYLRSLTIDEPLSLNGSEFYIVDALGSTLALTDASGVIVAQYSYEPFGRSTFAGGTSSNDLDYTGRENDGTGLNYYRARYYDPIRQRFLNEDPIGLRGGINLYAYAWNNPLRFTDPRGLQAPCYNSPFAGPECWNPDRDRTPGCDLECMRNDLKRLSNWLERNKESLGSIGVTILCALGRRLHCGPTVPGIPPFPPPPTAPEALVPVPLGPTPAEAAPTKGETSGRY